MFGTVISVLFAIAIGYVILKIGFSIFRLLATPLPEPPPAGELRKVKLNFQLKFINNKCFPLFF